MNFNVNPDMVINNLLQDYANVVRVNAILKAQLEEAYANCESCKCHNHSENKDEIKE